MYLSALALVRGLAGDSTVAAEILARLRRAAEQRYISPLDLYLAHMGAGEVRGALDWLAKAVDQRVPRVTEIPMPLVDSLRIHPRFAKLAAQGGLAPHSQAGHSRATTR